MLAGEKEEHKTFESHVSTFKSWLRRNISWEGTGGGKTVVMGSTEYLGT